MMGPLPLPQPIGDQFGWPEMVRDVAAIYNSLPPDERARTGIFSLFGPRYGLPPGHDHQQGRR